MEMDRPAEASVTGEMETATLWMILVHEASNLSCERTARLVPFYARSLQEVERLAWAWLERHPGYELEEIRTYPGGFAMTGRTWLAGTARSDTSLLPTI
jgi:hypothetical protein